MLSENWDVFIVRGVAMNNPVTPMASTDTCTDGHFEVPSGALGEYQYVSLVLDLLSTHRVFYIKCAKGNISQFFNERDGRS